MTATARTRPPSVGRFPHHGSSSLGHVRDRVPIGKPGGTVITVRLHHRFNALEFTLGRFRLAITRVPRPLGLGVTDGSGSILAIVPELRTEGQRNALLAYTRIMDAGSQQGRRAGGEQSPLAGRSTRSPSFGAVSRKPGDPSRLTRCC